MTNCVCGPGAPWCARTDELFGSKASMSSTWSGIATARWCSTSRATRFSRAAPPAVSSRWVTVAGSFACTTRLASGGRCWCGGASGSGAARSRPALSRRGPRTEDHAYAAARSKLTTRAIAWAVDALRRDDTTVSAIARHLGVDWHTAWAEIGPEAKRRIARPGRLAGVKTLGVDEHIRRPGLRSSTTGSALCSFALSGCSSSLHLLEWLTKGEVSDGGNDVHDADTFRCGTVRVRAGSGRQDAS